jgi:hypothetical protein
MYKIKKIFYNRSGFLTNESTKNNFNTSQGQHYDKSILIEITKRDIESFKYKKKVVVTYKGGLENSDKGLFSIAWKLSRYEGLIGIIVDENTIVFLVDDNKRINLIKKILMNMRRIKIVEMESNIEEQLELINNNNNQVVVDRRVYNEYIKEKKQDSMEDFENNKIKSCWDVVIVAIINCIENSVQNYISYLHDFSEYLIESFFPSKIEHHHHHHEHEHEHEHEHVHQHGVDLIIVKNKEVEDNVIDMGQLNDKVKLIVEDIDYLVESQNRDLSVYDRKLSDVVIAKKQLSLSDSNISKSNDDIESSDEQVDPMHENIFSNDQQIDTNYLQFEDAIEDEDFDYEVLDDFMNNYLDIEELKIKNNNQVEQDYSKTDYFIEDDKKEELKEEHLFITISDFDFPADDYQAYSNMLEQDIMNKNDIRLHRANWHEHGRKLRSLIDYGMINDKNNEYIISSLVDQLKEYGYSREFCENYLGGVLEECMPNIIEWRELRSTFTARDIELENYAIQHPESIEEINKIFETYYSGNISLKSAYQKLCIIFIKRGYSNNFIEFALRNMIKDIKNSK